MVAERAAAALSLGRLVEREHDSLEQQSHRALLTAMVDQSLTTHDLALRASGLGVSIEDRALIGVIVRTTQVEASPLAQQATVRSLTETVTQALKAARVSGLVGGLDERSVGLLLAAADGALAERSLTTLANRVRRSLTESAQPEAVVAAGSTVTDVLDVRRSFLEAAQVADVAGLDTGRAVHRLADAGLAGLLHLLRDDERVQTFVERELGSVLRHDASNQGDLLRALRTYLESGRNKSAAASQFGLSRPAFYERIRALEALLEVDLDDVGACLTLHVAIRSLDAVRSAEKAQARRET
jgi:purine catabolism regulator